MKRQHLIILGIVVLMCVASVIVFGIFVATLFHSASAMLGKRGDRPPESPLRQAVLDDKVALVKNLLAAKADPNEIGFNNERPLHLAKSKEMVGLLVSAGAKLSATNIHGDAALHYACGRGFIPAIDAMIAHCADVNVRNHYRMPPIVWAIRLNWDGDVPFSKLLPSRPVKKDVLAIMRILMQHGADVNNADDAGRTPLIEVCAHTVWRDAIEQIDAAKLLLDAGADVNAKMFQGSTALHEAVYTGNTEIVKLLLERGGDVTIRDEEGLTPLDIALRKSADPTMLNVLREYDDRAKKAATTQTSPSAQTVPASNIP